MALTVRGIGGRMKGGSAQPRGGLPPPRVSRGGAVRRAGGAELSTVGVRLDRDVDWDEVDAILREAYRKVGPKTLVKQLDAAD
jgi:hypothetical protein